MKNRLIIHAGPRGVERIILRLPGGNNLGLLDFIAPEIYRLNRALIACGALESHMQKGPAQEVENAGN
jgi:hypothetical protein